MFDHKRIIFTTADVGHHGEILAKIIYSWFNNSADDVVIRDKHLKFTKISMTSYGKNFLYSMLFSHNNLSNTLSNALAIRLSDLKDEPDNGGYMNSSWPVLSTIHLRDEFDMVSQINSVSSDVLCCFSPYNNLTDKELEYLKDRYNFYTSIYNPSESAFDTLDYTMYNINQCMKIKNRYDISIITDIVNGTSNSLTELETIFGRPSVTSKERLHNWLNLAHIVYKQNYEG